MTGEFDRPDRFGCGGLAMMLYLVLAAIATALAILMFNALGWLGLGAPAGGGNQPGGGGGGGGEGGGGGNAITYRGSDSSGDLPLISIRDFTAGDAPITTSGSFTLGETMPMHPPAAFADGTETTLVYGDMLATQYVDLAFSNHQGSEGLGLNVYSGDWQAVYQGQGCSWEVEVSDTLISGHIACTDIPAYNNADGSTGSIDLEMDFSATSPAGGDAQTSAP
jgi:hypothetical protein